jgi:hypothetical protein
LIIHVVKPGETLWQISNFYGVPLIDTINANKLPDPNVLLVGQSIIVPKEGTYHIVRPGETLWMIAQTYNTTINAILRYNNIINPDLINPGMRLFIPAPTHMIMPGGALLSAPFVYELGNEMGLKPSRSAVINLVFRHLAMFIFPYSTSLLVISATMPQLNIFKLTLIDLIFVFAIIFLGYFCFLKDIETTKLQSPSNIKQNLLKLAIYTSPIYVCIIINLITGLPFYITLIGSILMVYILGDKKDFLRVTIRTFNKNTMITLLTVATILIMKEIVINMEGLFTILQSIILASRNNILSTMLFFMVSSFILGFITGFDTTALAIVLPFMTQFNISGGTIYIYTYFIFGASFIGYYFSPLHLCQAFTMERMGVTTGELYKEYRFYMPLLLLFLIISTLILLLLF